jgi:hypothetical protein
VKYEEDQHLVYAAQEVRLIDTKSAGAHPTLSRNIEYPGFAIFESNFEAE